MKRSGSPARRTPLSRTAMQARKAVRKASGPARSSKPLSGPCWLAEHAVYERGDGELPPCDGRLIRAHLIPRQVLLRELPAEVSAAAVDDPRSWVPACGGPTGCGGHHGALDIARTLRIPRDALPPELEAFAAAHGLTWWLDRTYGPRP